MSENRPLGVSLIPLETRKDIILHVAQRADELGYSAFFLTETWAYDATVLLTEIALKTKRIKIGTSVLGVWGRSAATTAMASATLNEISNGRFILGLGASTPLLAEGFHDVAFTKPLSKLREMITQTRALLAGERIPLAKMAEARSLRLNIDPHPDIPIYMGATAPKSIQLAGELCDGWFPAMVPHSDLAQATETFLAGAKKADKAQDDLQLCPYVGLMVADTVEESQKMVDWVHTFYIKSMGPPYRNAFIRMGYEREVEAILTANEGRSLGSVPPEARGLIDKLAIYGTPGQLSGRLDDWYAAGADMPILGMYHGYTIEQYDRMLELFRPS